MDPHQYTHVEQDYSAPLHGGELPTYDDLAAQNGPNSRFGRWRGWIEKRAAERYVDIGPEERERRRQRGWGNDDTPPSNEAYVPPPPLPPRPPKVPLIVNEPPTPTLANLRVQTERITLSDPPSQRVSMVPTIPSSMVVEPEYDRVPTPPPLPPSGGMRLEPTHLKINQFGSRFLAHTTSQIRCLLPIMHDRLLLIGHDEGLSVLDMFPQEWTDSGSIAMKGPQEAQARAIWKGESVLQMSILEMEQTGEGTPQGVALLLVGPEPETIPAKDHPEGARTLRMYNLASLISLAKWTVAQKGSRQPLDLRRPSDWTVQQTTHKKHRAHHSLARGLMSLIDSPNGPSTEQTSGYQALLSPQSSIGNTPSRPTTPKPRSTRNNSEDSTWDMVDDLPLRWATDYVPLAAPGSRLQHASVYSYALWSNDERLGQSSRGGRLLAIVTKGNILLYETPKGERAFRFVKEFYTPMQPRTVTFFHQNMSNDGSQEVHVSTSPSSPKRFSHRRSASSSTPVYGPQLSLFVVFDKKAGWIRLADSAVGEIEMYDDPSSPSSSLLESGGGGSTSSRRSRLSLDSHHHLYSPVHPKWCPIVPLEIPVPPHKVCVLTRGKRTQIVPSPLPVSSAIGSGPSVPPLIMVTWKSAPSHVTARVSPIFEPDLDGIVAPPYMQLVGLGENGVEVQEVPLTLLSSNKGKGKAKSSNQSLEIRANQDAGGHTGFLCQGGHWDSPEYSIYSDMRRSYSTSSSVSYDSLSTEGWVAKMKREEGIYGWSRQGLEDWRVFWLGGPLTDDFYDDT